MVTGDIAVTRGDGNTKVAFKNCHPFTKCKIHLSNESIEDSDNLDIIMNMYNLIEYSNNYSDPTASLYQCKRQEHNYNVNNNKDIIAVNNNSSSFKYKSGFLGTTDNQIAADANPNIPLAHRPWRNAQIIVPMKYISSFFRSLEMHLINTKLYIQLNYTKHSVISYGGGINNDDSSTFKILRTELYVPVVTLDTEDNNKLNHWNEYKSILYTVYWNEYKSKIETVTQVHNDNNYKRTLLDTSIPGINRLFVMGFNNNDVLNPLPADGEPHITNSYRNQVERNCYRKFFLPRVDIKDHNVLIDGRNFYDQNISEDFKSTNN